MKDGKRTTEFWLALIVIGIGVGLFHFAKNDWAVFLGMSIVASVYIYGRKIVKTSLINNHYGGSVGGNYTGGDDINVGSIADSESIAVGREASSTNEQTDNTI